MAVNAGQRHVPDTAGNRALDACEYARELAIHTIKICNNKNIFKPEYQSALTNRIIAIAVDIYTNAWGANNILVGDNAENWHERHRLQELAANECNRLIALIQIAKTLFHLRQKKVKYWGNMTLKTRNYIQKWKEKDIERYGDRF